MKLKIYPVFPELIHKQHKMKQVLKEIDKTINDLINKK
jgi:hypothetical protein